MVDRITPMTSTAHRQDLKRQHGLDDAWPVVCEPFVQWVLEDRFVAGRPAWEKVGVQFTDDVSPYEEMKIKLLNGSHLALTYPASCAVIASSTKPWPIRCSSSTSAATWTRTSLRNWLPYRHRSRPLQADPDRALLQLRDRRPAGAGVLRRLVEVSQVHCADHQPPDRR